MEPKYADIHCHPHSRIFHWLRDTKYEKKAKHFKRFHPWTVVLSNFKNQKKGKRAFTYSQCDPVKLWNGKVQLVFASMYPMEKGFFKGKDADGQNLINRALLNVANANPGDLVNGEFGSVFGGLTVEGGETTLKDFFQSFLMKMPLRRVNYIQSSEYDYYDELQREYKFLISRDGEKEKSRIFIPFLKRIFVNKKRKKRKHPLSLVATGTYVVAKNKKDIESAIESEKLSFVITIEGMLSLGTDTHPEEVLNRIDEIKKWDHPIFFITFSHHFDNKLCGHAHSIIKSATLLIDQSEAMNSAFNNLGRQAARRLLSLDDDNTRNESLGYRILLDLKHMSATSRKEYYNEIVKPCMEKGDFIPVIASHVAYSGVKTLQEFEDNYNKEEDDWEINDFNAWNINVCDEDIEMIVNTRGLLGLCLDQRILGQQKKEEATSKDLVWATVKGVLDAVLNSTNIAENDKPKVWDIITMGTDFEGYIDPTDQYATSLDFHRFREDLLDNIQTQIIDIGKTEQYFLQSGFDKYDLVDKICFGNAYEFVLENV